MPIRSKKDWEGTGHMCNGVSNMLALDYVYHFVGEKKSRMMGCHSNVDHS